MSSQRLVGTYLANSVKESVAIREWLFLMSSIFFGGEGQRRESKSLFLVSASINFYLDISRPWLHLCRQDIFDREALRRSSRGVGWWSTRMNSTNVYDAASAAVFSL